MNYGLFRSDPLAQNASSVPEADYSAIWARDGKQILALGTKHRGELVRYDEVEAVCAVSFRHFRDRPDILP
jgi:hypothetical protein